MIQKVESYSWLLSGQDLFLCGDRLSLDFSSIKRSAVEYCPHITYSLIYRTLRSINTRKISVATELYVVL